MIFKRFVIIFACLILLGNCSSSNIRKPASAYLDGNCYSSIFDFFKIYKKFDEKKYLKLLNESKKEISTFHFDLLVKHGWPKTIAKRISSKDPNVAKEIIVSPYGINSFYKAYRGIKISEIYPVLKTNSISKNLMWGGDYYSQSHNVAKEYAHDIFKMSQGVVFEAYIPKQYTDLGVNQIWRSFVMTHPDPFLFINRLYFKKTNGEKTDWMSLEEAIEKDLITIENSSIWD